MMRFAPFCLLAVFLSVSRAQPLPEASEVLKRMQARQEALNAEPATNRYFYARTNVVEELESDGKIKKRTEKEYEVILAQGLPRSRLVAMDGRVLPESEQRWRSSEERKLQRSFTQDKNADPQKPKPWMTDDLLQRFQFKTTARTNWQGRAVLILTFQGRADAPVKNMPDRVINKLAGVVWVDEEEAEIVVLKLGMSEAVKFWGGVLGQLDKFDWTLQRARSPLGVWFNHVSHGLFHVRKLLVTSRYRVFEQATTPTPPPPPKS